MNTTLPKNANYNLNAVRRVLIITLGLNLVVALAEMGWGLHTHTLSLTADGFHSLLDAASNVVGIVALGISMQPPDPGHPYGHRKFEALAAMIISFFIFFTCFNIASEAFHRLFMGGGELPEIVAASFIIKAFGLSTNLVVTWYEHRKARELKNDLLAADAKHTLSDSLVSVSVIVSMAAVSMGWVWVDTAMALVIALIILRVGFQIISLHLGTLVDEAVLDPADIRHVVMKVPGALDCHKIRSRGMPDHIFIDLHVQVEPTLSIKEAHEISYRVEDALKKAYEGCVRDVLVHVEEFEGERPPVVTH